ncbi:UPF0182 family protein [Clostridium estertheticum]|uniref:UPF0182 family protein n=1 Tax=Clostridium estertheticum TaxID=238834 RepID=UPI001CF12115|nr:UPF0182 family protein [Clostridium estertheticum]MCB2309404.1 UPF0182 family protein [Clostridium estertheticum]MCB2347717.1 UPF0182 family protein [Clostridium estertheticum]MCB2352276.1 UPF0182 family protein [Clostridium estertheticum]WAG46983.1 UPF0182 family protein [Clostridium estertheticum]
MKGKKTIVTIIVIIVFIIIFLGNIVKLAINIQWFKEVGYLSVYFTKITSILKLMIPVFIVSYISIWTYYKIIKGIVLRSKRVEECNKNKEKIKRSISILINTIISFIISSSFASKYWYTILQFASTTKFNSVDPLFKKDISFFIFKLPLIESLYKLFIILIAGLMIITIITYIILRSKDYIMYPRKRNNFSVLKKFKSIRNVRGELTKFAGRQLAALSSIVILLVSLGYLIKSWDLVYSQKGIVFGASYTDVHVTLRFYEVISVVSLISAIIIFISILTYKIKPIVISIIVITILVIGENITSIAVQKFEVQSNEKTLEKPYIEYNIDSTRKAFNINNIDEIPFEIKNDLTKEDIKENKDTVNNIKVNSYKPALEFYNQFQYLRYYYGFNDIDIDRYNINGKYNQVFIAPREVNLGSLKGNSNTWQNRHLVYTHGYGVVVSKVNSVTSEGQPDFIINNIPLENKTDIKLANPRIYFGEKTNDYSIVNTKIGELDYPKGGENQMNSYEGMAGIKMNILNRILFAIDQKSAQFLLSDDITSNSKILIDRNILERVKKIAPFLTYDNDPYIVINGGRLYWIIDAYTTSNRYPYSQPQDGKNYIRNSVKVVIDALDGSPDFYIVDKNDPIVNSYSKIFPELFKNLESIPSGIKEHFKYPERLFSLQSNLLEKYHITDPEVFYNGDDVWSIAMNQEKIEGKQEKIDASYLIMKLPKESKQEMVLLEYFNTKGRDNMASLFGARMDGNNYGKMVLYILPPKQTVYSPVLFKQQINQDTVISKELSLWNTQGSQVQFGETVIVPIKNSLLYVEPMYLRAKGKTSIPEMKKVIVSYGGKIVLDDNIESALEQIFNINDRTNISKSVYNLDLDSKTSDNIKIAKDLYNNAMEAKENGKMDEYGTYIKLLGDVLNKAIK